MIDVRYHIYSLVAVFLALAIGIVIGTSFAQNSPLLETSKATVQRYEKDMEVLKTRIEETAADAKTKERLAKSCQDFCSAVSPSVVRNKLAGRNVALVRTGNYEELAGTVKQALETAGARVTSVTVISGDFPFDDESKIKDVLASAGSPLQNGTGAKNKLFAILAQAIANAKFSELLPALENAGVGNFAGDYLRFNKHVVLVGGSTSAETMGAEGADALLIDQFQKLGITVVACEGSAAGYSYVPSWHKKGIATVDNADTPMGQIALVYALNGENASFGLKDTADRLVPQTMEAR